MSTLLKQLPRLSPTDLRELVTRAQFLLKPAGGGGPAGGDEELAAAALAEVCRAAGSHAPPFPILLKSRVGPSFRKGTTALLSFLREHLKPETKAELVKCLHLFFSLAASDLKRWGRGVGPFTLAGLAQNPAAVFDRHFPNYCESGLLSMLIRREKVSGPRRRFAETDFRRV